MVNLNSLEADTPKYKVQVGTSAPDGTTQLTDISSLMVRISVDTTKAKEALDSVSASFQALGQEIVRLWAEPINLTFRMGVSVWKRLRLAMALNARKQGRYIRPMSKHRHRPIKRHGGNRGKGKRYAANTKAAHETKKAASALRKLLVSR